VGRRGGPGGSGGSDAFYTMLFSNKTMQLDQNVEVDSWNSKNGTYAAQATNSKDGFTYAGTKGGASSNGTIQLDDHVHVFGDVHTGPGNSVSMSGSAYVSGSTTPAPAKVPLVQIPVPAVALKGLYAVANGATKTISPGTYH
jgi:hypothetical protein